MVCVHVMVVLGVGRLPMIWTRGEAWQEGDRAERGSKRQATARAPTAPRRAHRRLVDALDGGHGVDDELGEEVRVGADDLRAHAGLGGVEQGLAPEPVDLDRHDAVDELDGLAHREAVAADDRGRVDARAHEVVGALQELRSEDHDRRRAVADLLVLQVGELDEDLAVVQVGGGW